MARVRERVDFGIDEEGTNVTDQIKKYSEELMKSRIEVSSIILFGSRVRGDYKPWSDIDLVVVAKNLPQSYKDRWSLLTTFPYSDGIEINAYTPHEFLKAIENIDLTALDSLSEGTVIYDNGFLRSAKKVFQELETTYKLRKTRYGWRAHL